MVTGIRINKAIFVLLILFVTFLFLPGNVSAKTIENTFVFFNSDIKDISPKVNEYIKTKKHNVYKSDIENGFYYFQPRILWTYADGDYVIISLKQIEKDLYLYAQSNYYSSEIKDDLLFYLAKNGYKAKKIKDTQLSAEFKKSVTDIISNPKNWNTYFQEVGNIASPESAISKEQNVSQKSEKEVKSNISPFRQISKAGVIFNSVKNGVVTIVNAGHGSGFLVDPSGLILTNYHVVKEQEDHLRVKFGPGKVLEAKVVETDPQNDIAVIWVNLENINDYTVLTLFNPLPDEPLVFVGEEVIAIGTPLDADTLDKTLTQGVVGKYNNDIIMHDASINHGNSGGPLINFGGYVVGINSFAPSAIDNNGLGGSIAITKAIPALEKAKNRISNLTPPSPILLPDVPGEPYSYQILKDAYYKTDEKTRQNNLRMDPYVIKTNYYYDIAIETPPQKFRKLANQEQKTLKRYKKRVEKAGGNVSDDEYESKTIAFYNYNKPVVKVWVIPKPELTAGSTFKALVFGTLVGTNPYSPGVMRYAYVFKKDFQDLFLVNKKKNQAYMPYVSGKVPLTQDVWSLFDYGTAELVDKTYIGYYEFDAQCFNNLDEMVFRIISNENKPPIEIKLDQKIKNYIIEDFLPYWKSIGQNP